MALLGMSPELIVFCFFQKQPLVSQVEIVVFVQSQMLWTFVASNQISSELSPTTRDPQCFLVFFLTRTNTSPLCPM